MQLHTRRCKKAHQRNAENIFSGLQHRRNRRSWLVLAGKPKGCDEVIKVTELNEVTGSKRYTGFGPIFKEDVNPMSPKFGLFFKNDIFSGFRAPLAANKVGLFTVCPRGAVFVFSCSMSPIVHSS
jgi:hypothetical protein